MVLVTFHQNDVDSTTITRTGLNTPSDSSLRTIIAYAHRIGLKVMLKPQLGLLNDPSHWPGQIGLGFTKADWTAWFASYKKQIAHYAQLAASANCEQFCVGCELDSTVGHDAAWRQVIAHVRAVYPGKITYANGQISPMAVTWWDAVDMIGQDAYPVLSVNSEPTVAELVAGWHSYYSPLYRVHVRFHRPVVFTEIGIRSVVGAAAAPWDWQCSGAVDLVGQRRWYEAALKAFARRAWMAGLFWWQWSPHPAAGGPYDTGYTPQHKQAEAVLRSWFTRKIR